MKKMLALVLSLVMVFGLVGCGKNAGGSDNDGSTKLTVWYWGEQEIPGYKQYMEEMAQKYSSETDGISVEVVLQESDTLYSALRTAEQAGEGPDLAFLWGGTQALDDVWLGNLAPISDYMTEEELSCMTASALSETNWDGKQWGFPAYSVCFGIAYNKQMFAAAGLDLENPPTTWQDFIAACDALKAAGYTPIGSGLKDGYLPGWLAVYFGAQNYDDPNEAIKPFRLEESYTDKECSQWIYLIEELIKGGYFNEDIQSLDLYQGQQLLETSNCAMTFQCGPYTASIAEKMGEDVIGFMQAPVYGSGELAKSVCVGQQVFVMPKSAKHKDQAADFLLFLAKKENLSRMYELTNAWMPTVDFDASSLDNEICKNVATWMQEQRLYDYQYTYPIGWENESLCPVMQKMFTEGLSAADAVNELQDGINKWAEQNANVLEAYKIWVVK